MLAALAAQEGADVDDGAGASRDDARRDRGGARGGARQTPTSSSSPAACRSARTTTSSRRSRRSASTERFWRVDLQPGKPTWFGTRGEQLVFGLPGNPVSSFVTFVLFARPALRALQGAEPLPPRERATLAEDVPRRGRTQALRVRLDAATARCARRRPAPRART